MDPKVRRELMHRAASHHDIETIYRQHGHSVRRRARQILASEEDAMDVMQELFASLVKRPSQLANVQSVGAWLYSAATHLCLNRIRDQKNRARLLKHNSPTPKDREQAASAESAAIVRQLLARLPIEQAQAVVYAHFDQMTHAEIADVMGCSKRHVGNLIERAQQGIKHEVRA